MNQELECPKAALRSKCTVPHKWRHGGGIERVPPNKLVRLSERFWTHFRILMIHGKKDNFVGAEWLRISFYSISFASWSTLFLLFKTKIFEIRWGNKTLCCLECIHKSGFSSKVDDFACIGVLHKGFSLEISYVCEFKIYACTPDNISFYCLNGFHFFEVLRSINSVLHDGKEIK